MTGSRTIGFPWTMAARFVSGKTLLRGIQVFAAVASLYFLIALALIYWPKPLPFESKRISDDVWSEIIAAESVQLERHATATDFEIRARDGTALAATRVGPATGPVIVLMHGVAADRERMQATASMLTDATGAEVVVYDHRGHGDSGGRAFDIDYMGQYEDDLYDVILALRSKTPARKVIIAGHSMGGGVAMRYALRDDYPPPDAYLLIAPNLGEGPTQQVLNEPAEGAPVFAEFDFKRMIGQIMLNSVGLHALDHMPVLHLNHRPAILSYSYRSVLSAQPIRPETGDIALQTVDVPLLVVVGSDDEVFIADAYPDLVSANSDGETVLIAGATHTGILTSEAAFETISDWYSAL